MSYNGLRIGERPKLLSVYTNILEQIFDEEWVKKNKTTIDNYIGKSTNPINTILLIFFQLNNENKEHIKKEYLRLIDYIKTTCSLYPEYSVSYYLNKLDQIYKYKLEYKKRIEEAKKN